MSEFEKRFQRPEFTEENCPEFDMYCIEDWEFIREGWLAAMKLSRYLPIVEIESEIAELEKEK